MAGKGSFTVGDWLVEPDLGRICRDSENVALRPQVMDLLVYLADADGGVARTEDLFEQLWTGKFVTEGTLYNCVGELRHALGGDRRYIETIPRKGYRLVAPVRRPDTEKTGNDHQPPNRIAQIAAGAAILIVAVGIFVWVNLSDNRSVGTADPFAPPVNSIAVLPFNDLSTEQTNEYLGYGISEALIHQLAQVPNLHVIARTSSFSFKGESTDIRKIGRALNVESVLEGSVQQEGDTLRIIAQLINVRSGSHVWSQKFDRQTASIFNIQDEIALAVAIAVSGSQLEQGDLAYANVPSPDPVAYELYMQGQYFLNTLFAPGQANTNMDAPGDALEFFQRATEADPGFALAWAARARALDMLTRMEKVPREEAVPMIQSFIRKALQLGPGLAEVQFAAGKLERGETALPYFDRAVAINPNYSAAHVERAGMLLHLRRYRDSFEAIAIAAQLDPLNGMAVEGALYASFYQGKWDDIEDRIVVSNRLWPDANGLATEAHLMFELGRFERFAELQRRAEALPGFGVDDWYASVPRHFGDTYLTLGLDKMARLWMTEPRMVARYDDVMSLYFGDFDGSAEFLKQEIENSRNRPPFAYRWYPDIVASLVETYLYQDHYPELVNFFEGLGRSPGLFPLPSCCLTNPPWPEVAYAYSLFKIGRDDEAQEWLDSMATQMEDRLEQGIRVPNHYYELARLRVMQGRVDDAFVALETAIDLGWRRWYFDLDPILDPIRDLPKFVELQARYQSDIETKRNFIEGSFSGERTGDRNASH